MREIPSLITLCVGAIKTEIFRGDDILPHLYALPSDLFDCLLPGLPPLALQKLQDASPLSNLDDHESPSYCFRNCKKRKRCVNFEMAWRTLYKSRWPDHARQIQPVDLLAKQGMECYELENDWNQMYWEAHLQNCLDAAAEIALLPSFEDSLGEIKIPDALIKHITCKGVDNSKCNYSKLSYHCQQFGLYARCMRLQNVLSVPETSHLLRNSMLERLELRWIKSKEHVEGLCKLLNQNSETITSLEFIHCKLSSAFMNAICDSLRTKGHQTRIQHFSIKTSSFLGKDSFTLPVGLASLLSSAKSLKSLSFCDDRLQQNFVKMVFTTLLDASSGIAVLDLSENSIGGWLSHFKWGPFSYSKLSFGKDKSLKSLRMLNLRNTNLQKDDVDCLKYALIHLPNLEILDLSENPIEDDGIKNLMPYFLEMSERQTPFIDLKLENCELSCNGVTELLLALSTFKKPLNALSIGENELGCKVGVPMGKFLCTGVRSLDVEDIGLGSSGLLDACKEIVEELKLVSINISKNRGGVETANFLSKLISQAPELVAVNAGYNFMPAESLSVICSCLNVAKGKLEQLDLSGNAFLFDQPGNESLLSEFRINGKPIVVLPSMAASSTPYDDDP
ncbi:hypothetical protein LguiB_000447 [Lonicera macranthoides]